MLIILIINRIQDFKFRLNEKLSLLKAYLVEIGNNVLILSLGLLILTLLISFYFSWGLWPYHNNILIPWYHLQRTAISTWSICGAVIWRICFAHIDLVVVGRSQPSPSDCHFRKSPSYFDGMGCDTCRTD